MEKIFFINTYSDYHVNGTNRSYWAKYFRNISELLNEKKKMRLYSSYDENMPIYEYYSEAKMRYVRIMQYNPLNELIVKEKYSADRYYTAWIDERQIGDGELTVPELVVCLLMTKTNIFKAEQLIHSWLFENDKRTRELIEEIYLEQEWMDEEGKKK